MALYWLGGQLTRLRWPQRTYTIDFTAWDLEGGAPMPPRTKNPRQWMMLPWGLRLAVKAMEYDRAHSDHWALDHSRCIMSFECPVCRGMKCLSHSRPGMLQDDIDGPAGTA
jgi:hypothetical protein